VKYTTNGWLDRLDDLFVLNYNDLIKFAKSNKGKLITGLAFITAAYIIKNVRS